MRVAVIGGTGFVGRHVLDELSSHGHSVVAIARRPPGAAAPDRSPAAGSAAAGSTPEFRSADAASGRGLDEALAGCEAVVWAAGSLRQSRGQTFHDIHGKGVRNLVGACRAARARRLVLISALGAHPRSRSAFLRAKAAGEELARRSLLDVTVLRPSAMYGRGDDFVQPLARMLRRMPVAPLPGRGKARAAPIAVGDVARAVAAILARPETAGALFDLPGPEVLAIDAIYDRILAAARLRRRKVPVPYLFIEPIALLLRRSPGVPFTFDHLALLEEEPAADPAPACRALGLDPGRFTVEAISALLE